MKAKLTITMDEELIPKAKRYAKQHGYSLSHLLEKSIQSIVCRPEQRISEKWQGRLSITDKKTTRFENLSKRYAIKEAE